MADIEIDSLQEFYTIDIDSVSGDVVIHNNKNQQVNAQNIANPQYGGLYAAFNENSVVTLDGLQTTSVQNPDANDATADYYLPGFCNFFTTSTFTGPRVTSFTTALDDKTLFQYSYDFPITGGRRYVRLRCVGGGVTTSSTRATNANTRVPKLVDLLANDFRSYVTAEVEALYTTTSQSETIDLGGTLFPSAFSENFFIARTGALISNTSSSEQGERVYSQGTLIDRPDGNYVGFSDQYKYSEGYYTGTYDELNNELTLDVPVVDRVMYFYSGNSLTQSYNVDAYTVIWQGGGVRLTVDQFVALLETTAVWRATIVEQRDDLNDPWVEVDRSNFNRGGLDLGVQDGLLNFGHVYDVTQASSSSPAPDRYFYRLMRDKYIVGKSGYLCRSKGNGLFDIYTATATIPGITSILSNAISQAALLPEPDKLSYSALAFSNLVLQQTDLPFWPHAIEGKDSFAVRNWQSMQVKKEDAVMYSTKVRERQILGGGVTQT